VLSETAHAMAARVHLMPALSSALRRRGVAQAARRNESRPT